MGEAKILVLEHCLIFVRHQILLYLTSLMMICSKIKILMLNISHKNYKTQANACVFCNIYMFLTIFLLLLFTKAGYAAIWQYIIRATASLQVSARAESKSCCTLKNVCSQKIHDMPTMDQGEGLSVLGVASQFCQQNFVRSCPKA